MVHPEDILGTIERWDKLDRTVERCHCKAGTLGGPMCPLLILPTNTQRSRPRARSCAALVAASPELVTIDDEALQAAVQASLGEDAPSAPRPPARLPLKFDSLEDEINFYALNHLLDFGFSHDEALQASVGRSSRETVEYGLMASYLEGRALNATFIAHLSKEQVG